MPDARQPRDIPQSRDNWDLRTRLIAIVALSLLPVAAISFFQGIDRFEGDRERARSRLVDKAHSTAADEQELLASAEQVLQALMRQDEVRGGGPECVRVFKRSLEGLPHLLNLARADRDGKLQCSALELTTDFDATGQDWWQAALEADSYTIAGPVYGDISRRNILFATIPFARTDGVSDGIMWAAIDFEWLKDALGREELEKDEMFAIVYASGHVIASTAPALAEQLLPDRLRRGPQVEAAVDSNGDKWSYSAAPLVGETVFVMYAQRDSALFSSSYWNLAANFLLPLVAIVLSSIAIWLATDRLIGRWIRYIRRVSGAYAKGRYSISPTQLEAAPRELRELGADLSAMAGAIGERDHALRAALQQKDALLKEIHHRVKNNLQIVLSLLSIESRKAADPAAEDALDRTRARVGALALIESLTTQKNEEGVIDAALLLKQICKDMRAAAGERAVDFDCDSDEITLPVDVAAPLALFAIEALSNSLDRAVSGSGAISVKLANEGGRAVLSVVDSGGGAHGDDDDDGDARRPDNGLIAAFARQLGSTLIAAPQAPGGYKVEINFPIDRAINPSAA